MPRTRQETRELSDLRKLVKQLEADNLELKEARDTVSRRFNGLQQDYEKLRGKSAEFLMRATRAEQCVVKLLYPIDLTPVEAKK